ncbi:MAG: MFS transporter [Actinomycetota bacterium]|nr:MFS transporter [Actinomycetota bacterium]
MTEAPSEPSPSGSSAGAEGDPPENRYTPLRFILAFGVVSMLADFVYEGGRSIVGPYLATLGASATVVGAVTGLGEAVASVLRLASGPFADRTRRYWPISIAGYAITAVSVPVLAATGTLWQASFAVIGERFGKAVRTPARDTMLSHASADLGRGRAFAYHEALDQSGALLGPLLVAGMVAVSGYRLGFAVLAVPAALALVALGVVRRAVPNPAAYEPSPSGEAAATEGSAEGICTPRARTSRLQRFRGFPRRFWLYSAFTAASVTGFATFGVLSYHLEVRHVVAPALIPVLYAVAMGVDALAALGSGLLYDRVGFKGLLLLPVLTAGVPFLSFSTSAVLVWVGAVIWGAALGIHESTMRAAVADLVPGERRGTGYGLFTAVYGITWLGGSTVIGALSSRSTTSIELFVGVLQALAVVLLVPLLSLRARDPRS